MSYKIRYKDSPTVTPQNCLGGVYLYESPETPVDLNRQRSRDYYVKKLHEELLIKNRGHAKKNRKSRRERNSRKSKSHQEPTAQEPIQFNKTSHSLPNRDSLKLKPEIAKENSDLSFEIANKAEKFAVIVEQPIYGSYKNTKDLETNYKETELSAEDEFLFSTTDEGLQSPTVLSDPHTERQDSITNYFLENFNEGECRDTNNLYFDLISRSSIEILAPLFEKLRNEYINVYNKVINFQFDLEPEKLHPIHVAINMKCYKMLLFLCSQLNVKIPSDAILHCVNFEFKEGIEYFYCHIDSLKTVNGPVKTNDVNELIRGVKSSHLSNNETMAKMFPRGITPLMLAAKNNNLDLVRFIFQKQTIYPSTADPYMTDSQFEKCTFMDFRLDKNENKDLLSRLIPFEILDDVDSEDSHSAFLIYEYTTWLYWFFRALSSPAFLIASHEKNSQKSSALCLLKSGLFVHECLQQVRDNASNYTMFYTELISSLESFFVEIVNSVQCSTELAYLFKYHPGFREQSRYNSNAYPVPGWIFAHPDIDQNTGDDFVDERCSCGEKFLWLLESAVENNMKDFNYSPNTLQVIQFHNYRFTGWAKKSKKKWIATLLAYLLYPFITLIFLLTPNIALVWNLAKSPWFMHSLWVGSEFWFMFLLVIHPHLMTSDTLGLASPFILVDYLLMLFLIGKIKEEIDEMADRKARDYWKDYWNWADWLQILALTAAFSFRFLDLAYHQNCDYGRSFNNITYWRQIELSSNIVNCEDRINWDPAEWRFLSDTCMSLASSLMFIRMLSVIRAFKEIGALQNVLWKMLRDFLQIFFILLLLLISFATATSHLFRYYAESFETVISRDCDSGKEHEEYCQKFIESRACLESFAFSNVNSFEVYHKLFWSSLNFAEYDAFDVQNCFENHKVPYATFQVLLAFFSILTVIVLLNMIIAMMTKTFEKSYGEMDKDFYFNKSRVFLRFMTSTNVAKCPLPAPMNLVPNFSYYMSKIYFKMKRYLTSQCFRPGQLEEKKNFISKNIQDNYEKTLSSLIKRYISKHKADPGWSPKTKIFSMGENFAENKMQVQSKTDLEAPHTGLSPPHSDAGAGSDVAPPSEKREISRLFTGGQAVAKFGQ